MRAVALGFSLLTAILLTGCGGVGPGSSQSPCRGCTFAWATTTSGEIATVPISGSAGSLGAATSIAGPANSEGIAFQDEKGTGAVYVADPSANAIRAYAVPSSDGTLSPAGIGPFPLAGARGVPRQIEVLWPHLYVVSSGGDISAFTIQNDNSLVPVPGSPFAAGDGASHFCTQGSVAGGSTTYLYVSDTDDPDGGIAGYVVDNSTGTLTPLPGSPFPTVAEGGPEGMLCLDGNIYVALHNAAAVGAYAIGPGGSLTPIAGSPYAAGPGVSSLTFIGGFVYAENSGTISGFKLDNASGTLTPIAGSPFPAPGTAGQIEAAPRMLMLPQTSQAGFSGFSVDLGTGAVGKGTFYPIGAPPLAFVVTQFPNPQ